ncbi:HEPN domain-containing protein [Hymenobacter rigui]|uniref:Uncharacterized protein n=1 Tax=Hymenobacter rigui TaxID=334424 RepID=A0A428KWE3_9BACT|nr:HEPN domain-containing protein [Hymenobacter rigui]RSK51028.1 hypothetical protein EI291_01540 [Hymenobacter rigui]
MSIPNIDYFKDPLKSLSFTKSTNEQQEELIAFEGGIGEHNTGKLDRIPKYSIWYSSNYKDNIDSLFTKIEKELINKKHVANNKIITTILYIYTSHPNRLENPVDSLNDLINLIQPVKVSQYFIMPPIHGEMPKEFEFGDFLIGILNSNELAYKCKKAGSDFYEINKNKFTNRLSVKRKIFDVNIINWHQFLFIHGKYINNHSLIDRSLIYFEHLSHSLFEDFWNDFNEQQNLQIALGLPDMPSKVFRERLGSQSVTIYSDIRFNNKVYGFVVPENIGSLTISIYPDASKILKIIKEELKKFYDFENFNESEIHQTIKSFAKFIAKGYRYIDEQRYDEGFLHFIIALDLVFGDANTITKAISERVSVLLSIYNKENYNENKTMISKLYAARSKYVHAGKSIPYDYIKEIKTVCRIIILILLNYQKQAKIKNYNDFKDWKKKLDYLAIGFEIGRSVEDSFAIEIGAKEPENNSPAGVKV